MWYKLLIGVLLLTAIYLPVAYSSYHKARQQRQARNIQNDDKEDDIEMKEANADAGNEAD